MKFPKNIKILVAILVCIFAVSCIYFLLRNRNIQIDYPEVVEPDAPLSENLKYEKVFGNLNLNNLVRQGSNVLNNNEYDFQIKQVKDVQIYKKHVLVLQSEKEDSVIEDGSNSFGNNNEVVLIDTEKKTSKIILKNNVSITKFIDENRFLYMQFDENPGIYIYTISESKSKLLQTTSNLSSINNIQFINSNEYFFIEPTTGKVGFKNLKTNKINLIAQKILNIPNNYVKYGAFSNPNLSPNKKFIAFQDNSFENNQIQILLVEAQFNTKKIISKINIKRDLNSNNIGWSNDSKYLILGAEGKIYDVSKKEFKLNVKNYSAKLSPDNKNIAFINPKDNFLNTLNTTSNKKQELIKDVSNFEWIDNSQLVFHIGRKFYTYDLSKKQLELVFNSRENFKIFKDNSNTQTFILINQNNLIKVTP